MDDDGDVSLLFAAVSVGSVLYYSVRLNSLRLYSSGTVLYCYLKSKIMTVL